jgi:ceramide glucosyltransferase
MTLGSALRGLLTLAVGASAAYQMAALVATRGFFRRRTPPLADAEAPPVSLLKPVSGADPEAGANFRSFCRQEYPCYEVLFGALDASDPALAVARAVAEAPGGPPVQVLASPRRHGANRKVSNLLNLLPHARYDLLVITDSDMRVTPAYLRAVAAPFRDPRVGMVTCPYRGARAQGLASHLEALAIATEFIPSVMVAERLGGARFGFGSTLALRRSALAAIGGLEVIADHLADDYELGRRVRAAGWEVVLVPYVVETVLSRESLGEMWRRRLRWARTVRACQPAGYRGSGITHTTPLALAALALPGLSPACRAVAAAGLAARLVAARGEASALGDGLTPSRLLLLPLGDLVSFALWCGGVAGRDVTWRGARYRLHPDGRITPVPHPGEREQKSVNHDARSASQETE